MQFRDIPHVERKCQVVWSEIDPTISSAIINMIGVLRIIYRNVIESYKTIVHQEIGIEDKFIYNI